MSTRMLLLLSVLWAAVATAAPNQYGVLHEERSLYTRILVHQDLSLIHI